MSGGDAGERLRSLFAGAYREGERPEDIRANDLLVRQRVAQTLSAAAGQLRNREAEFRRTRIPVLSREAPEPPRELLATAAAAGRLARRLSDLAGEVLGLAMPAGDRVWRRVRAERTLLETLRSYDWLLVSLAEQLERAVREMGPYTDAAQLDPVAGALSALENALRDRREVLQIP
ncbi:conserved protein of unknown function [Candidatus Hydrogenisulfobacillus filiaventi]|uniref:Uncharacterized protein n=1 Tax=Candidatus Hydrogenisulfobacillus filiaventi TaxID=2707344 RepID=A0A6F8ZJL2_9FIRM|nr:conserved protein of unknown function [Candidatus Hydrogenisulfobacillus filiaventi]